MADTALNITDRDLLAKLGSSLIGEAQKEELKSLVPDMTPTEKAELLDLIDQSNRESEAMNKNYQENLGKLNRDYVGKMNQAAREGNNRSRKEFEKLEQSQKEETLRTLEGEVTAIDFKPKKAKNGANGQSHAFRNLMMLLLTLVLLAGGALTLLNYLSNL